MMTREAGRSFLIVVAAVLLLRLVIAADAIFRPDGWNSFAPEYQPWQGLRIYSVEAVALVGPVALIAFIVLRLLSVRHRLANAGAILLAIGASPLVFLVSFGEPQARLALHTSRYDAIVAAHPGDAMIVFDWGETRTWPLQRKLEYLAFARADRAEALRALITNHNPEPYRQGDEEEIRSAIADAWNVAGTNKPRSWKKLVLDNCRLSVKGLASGYFYIVDDC